MTQGGKKICPDLQCPMKFKSNDVKIAYQVPGLCCLGLALIVRRISQILSKLTLIFCFTECKTYRKSPGKSSSHQIFSKSLQFYRNGICKKRPSE